MITFRVRVRVVIAVGLWDFGQLGCRIRIRSSSAALVV